MIPVADRHTKIDFPTKLSLHMSIKSSLDDNRNCDESKWWGSIQGSTFDRARAFVCVWSVVSVHQDFGSDLWFHIYAYIVFSHS